MNAFQHWLVSTYYSVNKLASGPPDNAAYMTEELPDTSEGCAVATHINPASAGDWQWTRWDYVFEAIAYLVLPVTIVVGLLFGGPLKNYALRLQKREKKRLSPYGKIVTALRDSLRSFMIGGAMVYERDHFYIGDILGTNVPVLIHKKLIQEHIHIVAPPGHGKSEGIGFILAQQHVGRGGSLAVFMGKRSESQVKMLAMLARAVGCPCYIVSLDPRDRSLICNPHEMTHWNMMDPRLRLNVETAAAGFDEPTMTSGSYFGDMNESDMRGAWRDYDQRSYGQVLATMRDPAYQRKYQITDREMEHGSKVRAVYGRASDITIVEATKDDVTPEVYAARVDFLPQLHKKQGIFVFVADAVMMSTGAAFAAKALFHHLMVSRYFCPENERVPLMVQLDDLQSFMDKGLEMIFRHARSAGVSICFMHQTMSNLGDYVSAVTGNTKVRIYAGSADPDMVKFLGSCGGAVKKQLANYSDDLTDPDGFRDVEVLRFNSEEILKLSMQPGVAIVDARPATGLTRLRHPVAVSLPWPCSREVYDAICAMPWPVPEEGSIIAAEHRPPEKPKAPPPPKREQTQETRKMFESWNQQ